MDPPSTNIWSVGNYYHHPINTLTGDSERMFPSLTLDRAWIDRLCNEFRLYYRVLRGSSEFTSFQRKKAMRMDGVPDGEGGLTVRLARMFSRWSHGEVLDPLRIYSQHPKILRGVGFLKRAVENGGALPDRIKSLAMHYTASQVDCPF